MKKVALYGRVSTNDKGQDPQIQIFELRKYCESRGWTVVHEIIDHASGGTDKREGYRRLLSLVEANEVDCICVLKLDRLFRSLKQLVTALDDFQSRGIVFVALKDGVDYSTATGKLFTQILGSLAEFEKTLVSERTKLALDYVKNVKGKKLGRRKEQYNVVLMQHLQSQGMSNRAIGKLTGCSHVTVGKELRRSGNKTVA